jgi:hypothetical protein
VSGAAVQYALLLYAAEDELRDPAHAAAARRDRDALGAELARSGSQRASHALARTATATTLRRRGGRTLLCDGPFAQTREPLGGVLVIEARDLDEAIAIAQRVPDAELGAIEIRPLRIES